MSARVSVYVWVGGLVGARREQGAWVCLSYVYMYVCIAGSVFVCAVCVTVWAECVGLCVCSVGVCGGDARAHTILLKLTTHLHTHSDATLSHSLSLPPSLPLALALSSLPYTLPLPILKSNVSKRSNPYERA